MKSWGSITIILLALILTGWAETVNAETITISKDYKNFWRIEIIKHLPHGSVQKANPRVNPHSLHYGDKIKLPVSASEKKVEKIATVAKSVKDDDFSWLQHMVSVCHSTQSCLKASLDDLANQHFSDSTKENFSSQFSNNLTCRKGFKNNGEKACVFTVLCGKEKCKKYEAFFTAAKLKELDRRAKEVENKSSFPAIPVKMPDDTGNENPNRRSWQASVIVASNDNLKSLGYVNETVELFPWHTVINGQGVDFGPYATIGKNSGDYNGYHDFTFNYGGGLTASFPLKEGEVRVRVGVEQNKNTGHIDSTSGLYEQSANWTNSSINVNWNDYSRRIRKEEYFTSFNLGGNISVPLRSGCSNSWNGKPIGCEVHPGSIYLGGSVDLWDTKTSSGLVISPTATVQAVHAFDGGSHPQNPISVGLGLKVGTEKEGLFTISELLTLSTQKLSTVLYADINGIGMAIERNGMKFDEPLNQKAVQPNLEEVEKPTAQNNIYHPNCDGMNSILPECRDKNQVVMVESQAIETSATQPIIEQIQSSDAPENQIAANDNGCHMDGLVKICPYNTSDLY